MLKQEESKLDLVVSHLDGYKDKEGQKMKDNAIIEDLKKQEDHLESVFSAQGFPFERTEMLYDDIVVDNSIRNCRERPTNMAGIVSSIKMHGLQSPIILWEREVSGGGFEYVLAVGWRRYLAMGIINAEYPSEQKPMFYSVPVKIYRGDLKDVLSINLIENLQREDLSPLEIGRHMLYLCSQFGMKQEELKEVFGKSQPYVSFVLKMAKGDGVFEGLVDLVNSGEISIWKAQAVAYKTRKEQEEYVLECRAALDGKKKGRKVKKGGSRQKKRARPRVEMLGRLKDYYEMDVGRLEDVDKSHVYGIMKGIYWCLNNDVQWEKGLPEDFGFNLEELKDLK